MIGAVPLRAGAFAATRGVGAVMQGKAAEADRALVSDGTENASAPSQTANTQANRDSQTVRVLKAAGAGRLTKIRVLYCREMA